ncbi:MAG: glycosyltransferase [Pseudomonadota bacterium]
MLRRVEIAGALPALNRPAPSRDAVDPLGPIQLGHILLKHQWVRPEHLQAAFELSRMRGRSLGDVLIAEGWAVPEAVAHAVAEQWNLGYADLDRDPPSPGVLDPEDLEVYLAHRTVPWRRMGGMTVYAVEDPEQGRLAVGQLANARGFGFFAVTTRAKLDRALGRLFAAELADRAADRTPVEMSVRGIAWARMASGLGLIALILSFFLIGSEMLAIPILTLFALNIATCAIRLAALMAGRLERHRRLAPSVTSIADRLPMPRVSLLVPLYREAEMIPRLIDGLTALDYPRSLLEVKILLEENDNATQAAIAEMRLPDWIQPLVVPDGRPRTKPRAMNYALDFCTGDVIGIFDAEDQPDPRQIQRVAEHFRQAPQEVACLQCQLSYFNARENWITRCFQLEYAIWFDVLLRGFERLRLPIPLGGTSVFFRRAALSEVGGWDAHNVTEDADLGMRLVRLGYRTEMVDSVTMEEANCRALPWVRQRSRWLKGYLMTWLCHMRRPLRLLREMGPRGFLGFNVLFLGGAATYLAMPLFWGSVIGWLLMGQSVWGRTVPPWMLGPLYVSLGAGQCVMLGTAFLAMWRRRSLDLFLWVPVLPFYWTLGSLAAWKAVFELVVAPYYWDKTRHGISRELPSRPG